MIFNSTILTVPGLTNSGEKHWQSLWENTYGFTRINQKDWDNPDCSDWIETIEKHSAKYELSNTLFVGHSLGCIAIVFWALKYKRKLKGALLVAPSDSEAHDFPASAIGFKPIPLIILPFRTILVASSNDNYLPLEKANFWTEKWGSELINIGEEGHINTASGLGEWKEGLKILKRLD